MQPHNQMAERLQKIIAQAGVASRRGAEELIASGEVTVNGVVVTELGTKADSETDHIKVRGRLINPLLKTRENVYILVNKPKGVLSSTSDPEDRRLVVDLVKGQGKLHPVGRLDYNTEGLIILTNDGDFTNLIASSRSVPKVYEVKVKGLPNRAAINKLRRGVQLEDGFKTAPAEIVDLMPTDKNGWYRVTLFEGHNQQIRKMFDSIGHSVVKLRRIAIGELTDAHLPVGGWRKLSDDEVRTFSKPVKGTRTKRTASSASGSAEKMQRPSRSPKPKPKPRSRTSRPAAKERPSSGTRSKPNRD